MTPCTNERSKHSTLSSECHTKGRKKIYSTRSSFFLSFSFLLFAVLLALLLFCPSLSLRRLLPPTNPRQRKHNRSAEQPYLRQCTYRIQKNFFSFHSTSPPLDTVLHEATILLCIITCPHKTEEIIVTEGGDS